MPETAPRDARRSKRPHRHLILLGYVGGFVGLVVMIVGLIMAGVGTFMKGSVK
jgi:hypothetical protein